MENLEEIVNMTLHHVIERTVSDVLFLDAIIDLSSFIIGIFLIVLALI